VHALKARERAAGLDGLAAYDGFGVRVKAAKRRLLAFLIEPGTAANPSLHTAPRRKATPCSITAASGPT
jgi:hypothetical protein